MAWLKDEDMKSFRQNQKTASGNEPQATKEYPPLEFDGEYLGGHSTLSGKRKVKLKLEEERILVCLPEFKSSFLGTPLLTVPYVNIVSVANMPAQQLSALQFWASGAPAGMMIPFKDTLKLTYRDNLDMEQICVFNMKKLGEAQREIYDRVVDAKKRQHDK